MRLIGRIILNITDSVRNHIYRIKRINSSD